MSDPPSAEPLPPARRQLPGWLRNGDVHEWSKTIALLMAALWAVYTFVWRDILVPSWAPASLVLAVQPREPLVGAVGPGLGSRLVRLRVSATNPGPRTLHLLANVWWASGLQRQASERDRSFETRARAVLERPSVLQAERGQEIVSTGVMATGPLFIDNQIQPGETLSRDLSIALPAREAAVVIQLLVPILTRNPVGESGRGRLFAGQRLGWSYSESTDRLFPVLCPSALNNPERSPCEPVTTHALGETLRRFDPRAVIFSRTIISHD